MIGYIISGIIGVAVCGMFGFCLCALLVVGKNGGE